MAWREVWRKDGYVTVEQPFQKAVDVEDNISFPETAEAGKKVDCGYINVRALETVKIRVVVLVNGNIATVDGDSADYERDLDKYRTVTFPIIFDAPNIVGKIKVSVVVYQWV